MELQVTEFQENMYILDDGRVRCFLFVGDQEALLVDCGFPDTDVFSEVKKITALPVRLVLTHGDGDHMGSLEKIGECMVHGKDVHMLRTGIKIHEIKEGDRIDAGQYHFEVVHIPGHTYGSIALLDEKNDVFLTGDSVQKNGPIFMFGKERNLPVYIETLKKLKELPRQYNRIFPSHNVCPLGKEAVGRCLEDAEALAEGRLVDAGRHEFMPCHLYKGNYVDYLYEQTT